MVGGPYGTVQGGARGETNLGAGRGGSLVRVAAQGGNVMHHVHATIRNTVNLHANGCGHEVSFSAVMDGSR